MTPIIYMPPLVADRLKRGREEAADHDRAIHLPIKEAPKLRPAFAT
jgi:hypothetical protein